MRKQLHKRDLHGLSQRCQTSAPEFVTHCLCKRKRLSAVKQWRRYKNVYWISSAALQPPLSCLLVSWQRRGSGSFRGEHVCTWHCPSPRESGEPAATPRPEDAQGGTSRSASAPRPQGPPGSQHCSAIPAWQADNPAFIQQP